MTTSTLTASSPTPSTEALPRMSLWSTWRSLLRWQLLSLGPMLPMVMVVQVVLSLGVVVGFGFLVPGIDSDPATALTLSTGAPTVLLMTIGFVMVPQAVSAQRSTGTYTYMRTLPIPRALLLANEMVVWVLVAAPSLVVAETVAWLRYDLDLSVDLPVLVGAVLLVTVAGASLGYALAATLRPLVAQLATQVLVFFVMLFSPVTFPASRLPLWLQALHDWLPVRPGAELVRAGLAAHVYPLQARDLVVVTVWAAGGLGLSLLALSRRG